MKKRQFLSILPDMVRGAMKFPEGVVLLAHETIDELMTRTMRLSLKTIKQFCFSRPMKTQVSESFVDLGRGMCEGLPGVLRNEGTWSLVKGNGHKCRPFNICGLPLMQKQSYSSSFKNLS